MKIYNPAALLAIFLLFAAYSNAQVISIPDTAFKAKLLQADISNQIAVGSNGSIKVDANNNGEIEMDEVQAVNYLNVTGIGFNTNIKSLRGIEHFTNLMTLECGINKIDTLDLTGLINLQTLKCFQNNISKINLSGLTNLEIIWCADNKLPSIDVNGLSNLIVLDVASNRLTRLNVNGLNKLSYINCATNQLTGLDFHNLPELRRINCVENLLDSLDLREFQNLEYVECYMSHLSFLNLAGLTKLKNLRCELNKLETLDLSGLTSLEEVKCNVNNLKSLLVAGLPELITLDCSDNRLTTLNIDGNRNMTYLYGNQNRFKSLYLKNDSTNMNITYFYSFLNNPDIRYVCADEGDLDMLTSLFYYSYNNPNVFVNSLCNSTANGNFYLLNVKAILDMDKNGCTSSDSIFPFLKIKIRNAADSCYALADGQGNFAMVLDSGSYSVIPQLPNDFFICSPTSRSVIFPEDTIAQQFCITPNGVHHDVSVVIVPVRAARPGFSDATYKMIIKNKGTQTEQGTVLFNYNESLQDYISSSQTPVSVSAGALSFAFTNLQLFETREITVTMRTNSPMNTPAVNAGDILQLSVTANFDSGIRDEFFKDNFQNIKQTVVGSIDPNDKTCLEGEIITPILIGDFLHYLIRFENTGTANAENIVVTDFIDLSRFDISTLELTSVSHACKTVISNGNKVQFVLDNINLPFTEPDKHGYIAFKIKTKSNLLIGDSLKNKADIYFDYNLPVATNTAASRIDNITAIKTNSDNEGSLSIYPNPGNGNFTVNFESPVRQIITVKIMGINGNVVYEQDLNHINQSQLQLHQNLPAGVYLITVNSEKEQYTHKLIVTK